MLGTLIEKLRTNDLGRIFKALLRRTIDMLVYVGD